MALHTPGNSAKPRAVLPRYLGGLALYFMLVPGLVSASLGVLALGILGHLLVGGVTGTPGIGSAPCKAVAIGCDQPPDQVPK